MSTLIQRALIGVAVVVVAFLVVKSLSTNAPGEPPSSAPPDLQPAQGTILSSGVPTQLAAIFGQQGEVPTPNPNQAWNTVFEGSGTDALKTDPFDLGGGVVRIHYSLQPLSGSEAAFFAVFLQPSDNQEGQSTSIAPDILAGSTGEGEKLVKRSPGSYILNVQDLGGDWTITVEEQPPA